MPSYADFTLAVLVLCEGIVALSGTMVPWGKTVLASPESSLYSWQISAAHIVFFFPAKLYENSSTSARNFVQHQGCVVNHKS